MLQLCLTALNATTKTTFNSVRIVPSIAFVPKTMNLCDGYDLHPGGFAPLIMFIDRFEDQKLPIIGFLLAASGHELEVLRCDFVVDLMLELCNCQQHSDIEDVNFDNVVTELFQKINEMTNHFWNNNEFVLLNNAAVIGIIPPDTGLSILCLFKEYIAWCRRSIPEIQTLKQIVGSFNASEYFFFYL